jgi:AcrR family transcriptional regulator
MNANQHPPDHRSKPRRRGEQLRDAILQAALVELAEAGYARLSLDRVAARARVSKASLYRRWPGKAELVIDTMYTTLPSPEELPVTGSLRGDLLALFRRVAATLTGPLGHALRGLLSDTVRDRETAERLRALSRGRGSQAMLTLVERAERNGELASSVISLRRLEAGHAMLRHEFLINGTITDDFLTSLVDEVVVPLLKGTS